MQNFWDPALREEFHYNRDEIATKPEWWFGEPMWETAGKAGLITANLMWPGPAVTSHGGAPSFRVPWRNHTPMTEKHKQIMEWIDFPDDRRPQLIMAYEPTLDQAGHSTGPGSAVVNVSLAHAAVPSSFLLFPRKRLARSIDSPKIFMTHLKHEI